MEVLIEKSAMFELMDKMRSLINPPIKKEDEKQEKEISITSKKSSSRFRARKIKGNINQCELCGSSDYKIEIHHKDKNALNNDISNLIGLCQLCHYKEHENEPIARIMYKRLLSV